MNRQTNRRGVALIIVLFLSAILTLMMYSFLREMEVEYSLASSLDAEKQADQLAWSAIEKGVAIIATDTQGYASETSPWCKNPTEFYEIELTDPDTHAVGVFTLIRPTAAAGSTQPEYGILDEASKLNLNVATRDQLMKLPLMTDEIADSILDWRDADDNPQGQGGESSYYLSLQPGYACKQAAFDTVDELLLVKGMTPAILYGEDINQNGVLDTAENDGDKTPPTDNVDGILDPGLIAYLTTWSYDKNVRADGTARVNINTGNAQQLRDALGDVLNGQQLNGIPQRRAAIAAATQGPGFRSGADLMDVPGVPMGGISVQQYRQVADRVTVVDGSIPALININTAVQKILELLPGLTADDVQAVLEYRTQEGQDLSNIGWLTGCLPVQKVQAISPFLTVRSYQFKFDAVGRAGPKSELDSSATVTTSASTERAAAPARVMKRYAAVFDAGGTAPRMVYFRDVSRLGHPYVIQEPQIQQ